VIAGWHLHQPDGQGMYFFIITVAAAEMAVGLGLVLHMRRTFGTLDIDKINHMRG
jgi:NADH-quinone oxidoreductase subunit K